MWSDQLVPPNSNDNPLIHEPSLTASTRDMYEWWLVVVRVIVDDGQTNDRRWMEWWSIDGGWSGGLPLSKMVICMVRVVVIWNLRWTKVVINDPVVFKFDVRSRENRSRTTSTIIVNKKNAIYIVSINFSTCNYTCYC